MSARGVSRRIIDCIEAGALAVLLVACSSSSLNGAAGAGGAPQGSGGVASALGGRGDGTSGSGGIAAGRGGVGGGSYVSGSGGSTLGPSDGPSAATCNPPSAYLCTGTAPLSDLISDFSIAAGSTGPTVFGAWGASVTGGTYVYPAAPTSPCDSVSDYPLTSTLSDGNWNISGTVGTYSGMGLWWSCKTGVSGEMALPVYASNCVLDVSGYTGISFKVSGDAGPKGTMTLQVTTPSTSKPTLDNAGNAKTCGTCAAEPCGTKVSVPVTATATMLSFSWAELGVVQTNAIEMITFAFADPCDYSSGRCVPTPYAVNVTFDDLTFTR